MWLKLISPKVTLRPMDSAFKRQMAPPLSLLTIAALTPAHHRVTIEDENVERLDLSDTPDLAGVSVKADTAQRSWAIAASYRKRGIPVILGGIHPTACPEENAKHADAIVVGEAETLWAEVLRDAGRKSLKRIYRSEKPPDLTLTPIPRWELIAQKHYLYTNTITIGRGCPWRCDFCYNSSPNLPKGYRAKPIHKILEEIDSLGNRHVMFIDDNFISDPSFTRELLTDLLPLGLVWHTAVSVDIGRHEDILDLMAESGCRSLFIGFETLNAANLQMAKKKQNRVEEYERTIAKIHNRGMMVNASVVFGFDKDQPSVFKDSTEWLIAKKVETMTAHILTPYPGTALHARLMAESRIFDHELTHYNTSRVVFRPKGMSVEELEAGYLESYRHFYTWQSIWKRFPADSRRRMPYLLFNIGYRKYGQLISRLGAVGLMSFIGRLGAKLSYSPGEQKRMGNQQHVPPIPPRRIAQALEGSLQPRS